MTTTQLEKPAAAFSIAPITFEATKEALEEMVSQSSMLTVAGADDKEGIAAVRAKRLEYKKIRTSIENRRKELKADALKYGQEVDGMAKALTAIIEGEEDRLKHEEDIVKREQERLAKEAEEKRQAMVEERCRLVEEAGAIASSHQIAGWTEEQFAEFLTEKRAEKKAREEQAAAEEAERQRVAAEQKAEAERLAKEREELERQRKEQEAAAAAERRKEEERLAAERAELERQKKEAEFRNQRIQARTLLLADQQFAHSYTGDQLADMPPAEWEQLLETARRRRAERDRAASEEQARLERQRLEQEAEQQRIEAENNRIYDARVAELAKFEFPGQRYELARDVTHADFVEILEQAKELRAKYDAEQAAAVEREKAAAVAKAEAEAKAKAEAEERERQRIEALKPDHEKLLAVADAVEAIKVPEVSEEAQAIRQRICDALRYAAKDVRGFAGELIGA